MTYIEKYKILDSILHSKYTLFSEIKYEDFIDALILSNNVTEHLNISDYRMRRLTSVVFPDKGKGRLINYILYSEGYKYCKHCDSYLILDSFRPNKANIDGVNSYCSLCHAETTAKTQPARQAKYVASKIQRTPSWANLDKISDIYKNCPEGYHVDHIYPLNGTIVCGLHVEDNLQYLLAIDNIKKGNRVTQ
jgi:hypothetical protein